MGSTLMITVTDHMSAGRPYRTSICYTLRSLTEIFEVYFLHLIETLDFLIQPALSLEDWSPKLDPNLPIVSFVPCPSHYSMLVPLLSGRFLNDKLEL